MKLQRMGKPYKKTLDTSVIISPISPPSLSLLLKDFYLKVNYSLGSWKENEVAGFVVFSQYRLIGYLAG